MQKNLGRSEAEPLNCVLSKVIFDYFRFKQLGEGNSLRKSGNLILGKLEILLNIGI